jgi:hypothetical protein
VTVINVAILVYPGVEMIDMNGPLDVLTLTPTFTLANHPQPDIIVIPGQVVSEGPPPVYPSAAISINR